MVTSAPKRKSEARLGQLVNVVFSFGFITVMFAFIYKIVPRRKIVWGDVWIGAPITSMLFSLGKQPIGIYLGRSLTISAFGTIGSLAVFLLWVYYSAQIFLLGAEFTHVYARARAGSPDVPMNSQSIPQITE